MSISPYQNNSAFDYGNKYNDIYEDDIADNSDHLLAQSEDYGHLYTSHQDNIDFMDYTQMMSNESTGNTYHYNYNLDHND